jgi:Protein of unknown function (DUF3140)
MATAHASDEMWQEFHREVNMTPDELKAWLRAEDSDTGQIATEVTQRVLDILSKAQQELTEEDVAVMESVVSRIRLERRDSLHPTAGDDAWRDRLLALGHDPDKIG